MRIQKLFYFVVLITIVGLIFNTMYISKIGTPSKIYLKQKEIQKRFKLQEKVEEKNNEFNNIPPPKTIPNVEKEKEEIIQKKKPNSKPPVKKGKSILNFLSKYSTSILILTYNRPKDLQRVVESVSQLHGIENLSTFIISQDGTHDSTTRKINSLKSYVVPDSVDFKHFQRTNRNPSLDSLKNIAQHYHFAVSKSFEFSDFVIILEDDIIPSPDMLTFFDQFAPFLLNKTEKVWCVSTWNDFGFKKFYLPEDKVMRTQFFPGLGWMIHKSVWEEIDPFFPPTGWDFFFRTSFVHKHRDCIVPFLPRSYNIGDDGATVSSKSIYRDLLQNIDYSKEKNIIFDVENIPYVKYEEFVESLIKMGKLEKLNSVYTSGMNNGIFVIPYMNENLDQILRSLGITYHTQERTHHNHLIMIHKDEDSIILLINVRLSKYKNLLPSYLRIYPTEGFEVVKAKNRKETCNKVCEKIDKKCQRDHFDFIMSCDVMQEHFPCERGCQVEVGDEIPCYVAEKSNRNYQMCVVSLTNENPPHCDAKHKDTVRLCPCVP